MSKRKGKTRNNNKDTGKQNDKIMIEKWKVQNRFLFDFV